MARVAQLHDNVDKTRYYTLKRENIIGRAADVDIYFDNKRVSRRHARVAAPLGSDAYYVEDICARGVYVNFRRVQGRYPLKEGDRICILQFRNIHPLDLERMTDRDLKSCCDDPRNTGVKAIVDLTFQYAEVQEAGTENNSEPQGLLAKLKALLGAK
jgi:hypothetical protein